jgi:hypothetical protein
MANTHEPQANLPIKNIYSNARARCAHRLFPQILKKRGQRIKATNFSACIIYSLTA